MRFALPILLLAALLALFYAGLQRDPREVPSPLIGKPAPAFALPGLGGTPPNVSPADFKGRPVLLNFFASWCAGCREEHPLFIDRKSVVVGKECRRLCRSRWSPYH
jgi:cytochrome c biogenesis protein CcmG/thiol:disulfide interchange protein DsbE